MRQTLMSLQGMLIIIALILQGARTLTSWEEKLVCPEGWDYFENANMCLQHKLHSFYNYSDGQRLCQNISNNAAGSGLPILLSVASKKALGITMRKLGLPNERLGDYVWVGGDDIEEEGSYRWRLNGQFIKYHLTDEFIFKPGQPNDGFNNVKQLMDQDCLVVTYNVEFNDYQCYFKHNVICSIYNANLCSIQNGGCEQKCIITGPHARRCECEDGFTVQGVVSCEDVDECLDGKNGNCQHICSNFHGGRECFCHPGYFKNSETSCVRH